MGKSLFFYGTLCHLSLLEIVLGRTVETIAAQSATLAGHKVSWVQNEPFPTIEANDGTSATGLLVSNLSETDVARLDFYEGGFAYTLRRMEVDTEHGQAWADVYFPEAGLWTAGEAWSLDDWVRGWGDVTLNAAREAMALYGVKSPGQMAHLMPFLRARSWARHLAQNAAPHSLRGGTPATRVTLSDRGEGYRGFFRFDTFDLSFQKFDGTQSHIADRGCFISYDAAVVLPYDPIRDEVLLVEQMRFGPLLRGDPKPWILEAPAGLVDAGEDPVDTARREASEEADVQMQDMLPAGQGYAAPGYSTEYYHLFVGICDLSGHSGGLGGLASEHEDIRSHVISFDRAMSLLESGEINVAPLANLLLWLGLRRNTLRARHTVSDSLT